jgi:hypothetical protein
LVIEVDVRYKTLLKASELFLLLLRHDDKSICGVQRSVQKVEWMIVLNDEVGWAAPPYVLEVR